MKDKFICLFLACLLSSPSWSDTDQRKRLQQVQKDIGALQKQLARTSSARDKLALELQDSELALVRVQEEIDRLEIALASQGKELLQLEARAAELEKLQRQQSAVIQQEVVAAYRLGTEEPVKMLLNQQNPDLVARQLRYYQYFLDARANKLNQYRSTMATLNEVKAAVADKRSQLLDNRNQLEAQQQELREGQHRRRQLLAAMEQQLGSEKERLDALQQQRRELEEVIAALERAIRELNAPANTPFARSKGKMVRPADGKVVKAFGARRAANLNWLGWLVSTRAGAPVRTIHHGRVVFSDYLRGQGLLIIIDHGDGYLSLYAHNQNLLRETGDWVQAGDTIANAGNSGGLEESALYFEIRHNGKPLDPSVWLARK